MNEDKSKLQLISEIAQADNKNLELIEEINNKEDEIERLNNIIKEVREYIDKEHKLLSKDKNTYAYTITGDDILGILDKGK